LLKDNKSFTKLFKIVIIYYIGGVIKVKKNGFLSGAFVSTAGVIICKIVGLLYVIPFYQIIGSQGGALYSYAYTIYSLFLTLSSQGIPAAMSKIVSEYNTKNYQWSKEKAYRIVRNLMVALGTLWFIVMMFFAEKIAYLIIGNVEGGNTIADVALVIRCISSALIIVPFLSTIKGYLSGHKYISLCAISNVIEQIVRVLFVLIGSYIAARVFNFPIAITVGVAVFGATVGAFAAYLYLVVKRDKNKSLFKTNARKTIEEKNNTTKTILKRIILTSLPFVVIEFVRSIYSIVDTFTVNSTLTSLGYSLSDSEYILSVISTWGSKINMIVIAFVSGLTLSLIPTITTSYVKGDLEDVNNKLNQSFQIILFVNLPLIIGLYMLATPVWTLFYGYNELGISIFKLYVFQAISFSFYSLAIDSSQVLGKTKLALGTLFISFTLKALLNTPFMRLCSLIGINAGYGPIILNIILHFLTAFIIIFVQIKKYKISYRQSINPVLKTILISLIMFVSLLILELFVPVSIQTTKINYILLSMLYAIVGGVIYIYLANDNRLLKKMFGFDLKDIFNKIFKHKKLIK